MLSERPSKTGPTPGLLTMASLSLTFPWRTTRGNDIKTLKYKVIKLLSGPFGARKLVLPFWARLHNIKPFFG